MLLKRLFRRLFPRTGATFLAQDARYSDHVIGEWTYGHLNVARWQKGGQLKVGRFCSFAEGVTIMLGGEHRTDWVTTYAFPTLFEEAANTPGFPLLKGDVNIGNDVWIGRDTLIMSGISIGDGAVIGARSVVRKDVAPYSMVAGNPARFVGYRVDKDLVDDLLAIAWWNWPLDKIKEALPQLLSTDIKEFVEKFGEGKPAKAEQAD